MLQEFVKKVKENNILVDSIIITKNDSYDYYYFNGKDPKDKSNDEPHSVRSISKTVSCLGAFVAIEEGLYGLETNILQFFDREKITNTNNIPFLEEMKIKHLMKLTIGQEKGLMFSKDIKVMPEDTDFIYYILNYDIKHRPENEFDDKIVSSFVYNNAATYLLCAITQKLTGEYFRDWIQHALFEKMDDEVKLGEWEMKQGVCLGASGLSLRNEDMHKIALLLLNNGNYKGQQLIMPEHIKEMHTPQVFTANLPDYVKKQGRCINKMAYGYGLWICGNGSEIYPKTHYFCDGTDGQLLIVSPKDKMAITILSHQKDMEPIYEALNVFF